MIEHAEKLLLALALQGRNDQFVNIAHAMQPAVFANLRQHCTRLENSHRYKLLEEDCV
jgi:alpha-ketoglutarate-dependent taurine dioxygenase